MTGARRDDALAKTHTTLAQEKRQERADLQRELREREKDERATTERGGLGSAAQQGAAAANRETPRPRSQLEEAIEKAAHRGAAPDQEGRRGEARSAAAGRADQEARRPPTRPAGPRPPLADRSRAGIVETGKGDSRPRGQECARPYRRNPRGRTTARPTAERTRRRRAGAIGQPVEGSLPAITAPSEPRPPPQERNPRAALQPRA